MARSKSDAADATARAARFEAAAAAATSEATRARARSAAVAARIQSAEAEINAAETNVALIERVRARQRAALALKQGPTIRLVAALQSLSRRPPALALVQPGSIADMVHVRAMLAAILPDIQSRTADVRAEVARGKVLQMQAADALTALQASRQTLVEQRRGLSALAVQRRHAAHALSGNAMIEQDRAIALGEEARDIADLMGRIDADAGRRARLASLPGPIMRPLRPGEPRPLPPQTDAEESAQAPYRMPVIGQVVTGLGEISRTGITARGLTIATRPLAQVVAPTGGRVAFAGPYRGFGQIVILDHGRGWTTLITSLAGLDVRVGDSVDPGSPIGRAGPVRPTVTVELRRNGQPVDIARLVSRL